MKQILRKGLKDIIVDEVPDPVVTPHPVLVPPIYSLISSGTETSQITQGWNALKGSPIRTLAEVRAKFSEYAILGYSGAGLVAEKHPSVTDIEVGDRVAYGGAGAGNGGTAPVGRNLAARIPDNVSFDHACFTTLGSIALNGVRIANISLGERVAVIGLGLVGQLVAQLARLQGGFIVATDLRAERVDLARRLGADEAMVGSSELSGQIRALTNGQGVDCVIIAAAAKSDAPCRIAVDLCRDRGRIVDVGAGELSFPGYETSLREIRGFVGGGCGPGS